MVALLIFGAGSALAQVTVTWGGSTGSWNVGSNWVGGVQPGVSDTAQVSSGSPSVDSAVSLAGMVFSGGTITGSANLTFTGTSSVWSGGTLTGAGATQVLAGGTLALTGTPSLSGRSLTNAGTVNFAPASFLSLTGSGTFTNTGLWNFQNNANFGSGTYTFVNQSGGILRKSSLTGQLNFNLPLTNNGVVDIAGGTFQIDGGGSATGAFALAADSLLIFNSNFTLNPGASFSAAGILQLASNTLTLGAGYTFSPADWSFIGGTLTGDGAWEVPLPSTHFWSSGTLSGTGATTVKGTLIISGGSPAISGRSITNQGTVSFMPTSNVALSGNVAFVNAPSATFDLAGDNGFNRISGTHTFANQAGAILTKSAGTGILDFSLPVTNAGQVTVSSGTLLFSSTFTNTGGAIVVADGATAQFSGGLGLTNGVLTGNGTIIGDVSSGGLIAPGASPGQLNITGNLTLLASSITLFELGGLNQGSGYDFLNVSGTASLGGNLQLSFVNGFQSTILPTDTFTLLSASLRTGAFANAPTSGLRLPTTDGFGSFQVDYTGITVNLTNFAPVPEPATWALLLLGGLLVTFQLRRRQ